MNQNHKQHQHRLQSQHHKFKHLHQHQNLHQLQHQLQTVGGGLPVAVYGGRADIMEMVAPLGSIYQAGTLSGNPLAMAAGAETLTLLQAPGVYAA